MKKMKKHVSKRHNCGLEKDWTKICKDLTVCLCRVMFPDMEAEVIEAVLRANSGAVDATIDHLLAMTADNEAMAAATAAPPPQPQPPAHKSNQQQQQQSEKASQVAAFLKSGGTRGHQRTAEMPPSYSQVRFLP